MYEDHVLGMFDILGCMFIIRDESRSSLFTVCNLYRELEHKWMGEGTGYK